MRPLPLTTRDASVADRDDEPAAPSGRSPAWSPAQIPLLALLVLLAIVLRAWQLSAEGFSDDEVHKWLAAQRYLAGDFGGDDLEHPMLMKWLVVAFMLASRGTLTPEAVTRLPNVVASGLTVLAVAALGRRLYGRASGLIAAALTAVEPTFVGYSRLAKEDSLCALFLALLVWCVAEAQAAATGGRTREQESWELRAATFLGMMLASKYFLFFAPIPLLAYLWLRTGGSPWRVPVRRWAFLLGVSLLVFIPLDFVVLRPSTWAYVARYLRGDVIEDRMTSESVLFMGRRFANFAFQLRNGPPLTYWPVFAAVKLAPPTVALGALGLVLAALRRSASDRIVLAWIGMWLLSFTVASVKYARYFLTVLPALLLLVAVSAVTVSGWATRAWRSVGEARGGRRDAGRFILLALAAVVILTELGASLRLAPHYRLYVSALGGGERNVSWFFPQCDYADAGAREAIGFIASRAEPGAEITSEIVWPVRLYASAARRGDLHATHLARGTACREGRVCYVIIQEGRSYWHNLRAVDRLSRTSPWHVERIRGAEVVKVYRLAPGDVLFPE